MPCQEAFQLLKDSQQQDWCSWGRTRRRSTPWPRRRWSRRGRRGGECVVTLHHLSFRVQFSKQLGLKIGYPMEYPLVDHQFPQFKWPVIHGYALFSEATTRSSDWKIRQAVQLTDIAWRSRRGAHRSELGQAATIIATRTLPDASIHKSLDFCRGGGHHKRCDRSLDPKFPNDSPWLSWFPPWIEMVDWCGLTNLTNGKMKKTLAQQIQDSLEDCSTIQEKTRSSSPAIIHGVIIWHARA